MVRRAGLAGGQQQADHQCDAPATATGRAVQVGRYVHLADSYHIYGSYFRDFERRFLGALQKRTFEQRTLRYADVREMMEEARPAILEKARTMG